MTKEESALLKTMGEIVLEIRSMGYAGGGTGISPKKSNMLGDLADAIHNIPDAIIRDDFDADFHARIMLGGFDERYRGIDCIKPYSTYKHILANGT